MGSKRSEISVLSIASLDVFASALGVFIILTAVALPFLFNTEQMVESDFPNADQLVDSSFERKKLISDLKNSLKKMLEYLATLEAELAGLRESSSLELENSVEILSSVAEELEALQKKVDEQNKIIEELEGQTTTLIPPIDLVFLLDTTGSMSGYLRDLQTSVYFLAAILTEWSESPAIGLIEILDQCDYSLRKKFEITQINYAMVKQFESFVFSLGKSNLGCNMDSPEAIHLALEEALRLKWRGESEKKIIVIISDNPPYPNQMASSTQSIVRFVDSNPNNSVSVVHPNTNGFRTRAEQLEMLALARSGKGQYIDASGSFLGGILLAIK